MNSRLLTRLASFVLLLYFAPTALAQEGSDRNYPHRQIRVIVGYGAGGGTDIITRILSGRMSEGLGQPVIVENRPGAQGIIGVEYVKRAVPDGYTVLMGPIGAMTVNPAIYSKLPYSTLRDFVPISQVGVYPFVLVINSSQPFHSVKELVAYAKTRPNNVNYAEAGALYQLASELFKQKTGTQFVHIPYKSSGDIITSLIANQVTMAISDAMTVMGPLKSGKLRGLAVTSAARYPAWPDIPTMGEAGVSDMEIMQWTGFFVPATTPPRIVKRLQDEVARVVKLSDIRERLDQMGIIPVGNTSEEFGRIVASEIARWTAVAKAANIKAD